MSDTSRLKTVLFTVSPEGAQALRSLPLVERKRRLKRLIGRRQVGLLYVSHIEANGSALFAQACKPDLEGIVAKRKDSPYRASDKASPL